MKYRLTFWLLLTSLPGLMAQPDTPPITAVSMRLNTGIGISNKPGVMFGAPFALSGELSVLLRNRWRIAAEGGIMEFRDAKYPDKKIGLIFSSYSRYGHGYFGLLIGHSLLNVNNPSRLFLSSGADYLLIVDPNVKRTSGFFAGYQFDYRYERYLNIPIQLDYSIEPFAGKRTRIVFVGRWNFNAYHSFPMVTAGVDLPMYPLPRR